MDPIVEAARSEEQRLTAQLAQNPIYIKLQAVQNLLKAYQENPITTDKVLVVATENVRTTVPAQLQSMAARNVAAQVRAWVLPLLKERGNRVQSNELADMAIKAGIQIGGKSPTATMSSYLSNMPELNNVRGLGYGLKEWTDRDEHLRNLGIADQAGISSDHDEVIDPVSITDLIQHSEQNTEEAEKDSGQEPSASPAGGILG